MQGLCCFPGLLQHFDSKFHTLSSFYTRGSQENAHNFTIFNLPSEMRQALEDKVSFFLLKTEDNQNDL